VREVHDAIARLRGIGYTTVLKQMQVMHQKGLLQRQERFKSHVYVPAQSRSVTQRLLAGQLLKQAFDGSASGLLQSALAGRRVDAGELEEIRALLAQVEKRSRS
jgi:predicted transcriptional regulator